MKKLVPLVALALAACATTSTPTPEPVVVTKEVKVAVPVPCPALAKLGPEPAYDDTDAALAGAPDVFESSRLLLKGRLQRARRLLQYVAARAACSF